MRTVVLLNAKGGVGKTTVAAHLVAYWARNQQAVGLIDCDPLETAARWCQAVVPNIGHWGPRSMADLERDYQNAKRTRKIVVIDGVARLDEMCVLAAGLADLICVPITPSVVDLAALEGITPVLRALQEKRPHLKIRVLVNNVRATTRAAKEMLAEESVGGWRRLEHVLPQREAYREAYRRGCTVADLGYRARGAAEAMARLCWEIAVELKVPKRGKGPVFDG